MSKMDLTRRGVLQTTNLLAAGTMLLGEAALAGLAESPFSIQSTQVKRVRFKSRRSFDEVLQRSLCFHTKACSDLRVASYRCRVGPGGLQSDGSPSIPFAADCPNATCTGRSCQQCDDDDCADGGGGETFQMCPLFGAITLIVQIK